MFRPRRRPTPGFKIPPPFNPITGEYANLQTEGTWPYCAMMQIAAEDEYDDYVICRGFDPRILKFIDYEAGNPESPGISVAKPFGNRRKQQYAVGEIFPALLPIQGSLEYTPPLPVNVKWRLGQNPGVVEDDVTTPTGHPTSLGDSVEMLYDHNNLSVSWLLIDHEPSDRHYLFQLVGNFLARSAVATIYKFDGANIGNLVDVALLYDPLSVFSELVIGDRGYCFYQDGKYYAIQAPCPEDQESSIPPVDVPEDPELVPEDPKDVPEDPEEPR